MKRPSTSSGQRLVIAVLTAALLWFYMFSPWTGGWPNFWVVMSCSAVILTTLGLSFTPDREELLKIEKPALQLLGGIVIGVCAGLISGLLCSLVFKKIDERKGIIPVKPE